MMRWKYVINIWPKHDPEAKVSTSLENLLVVENFYWLIRLQALSNYFYWMKN